MIDAGEGVSAVQGNEKKIRFFNGQAVWAYFRYQVWSKALLALLVLPGFRLLTAALMRWAGRRGISSGDFAGFLLSPQGAVFAAASLAALLLLIGIDINALVILSAAVRQNQGRIRLRRVLAAGVRDVRLLLNPAGLLAALYIALIIPLVGLGMSVSAMKNLAVPNFVADVIFHDPTYTALYAGVMAVLSAVTVLHLFFMHAVLLGRLPVGAALKQARRMMAQNWKAVLKALALKTLLPLALLMGLSMLALMGAAVYAQGMAETLPRRMASVFVVLLMAEAVGFWGLLPAPLFCHRLTGLYLQMRGEEPLSVTEGLSVPVKKRGRGKKIGACVPVLLFLGLMAGNGAAAAMLGAHFDEIFRADLSVQVVAHRGGGDLAAENSLLGMQKAQALGAQWSEIDVQRTKDGAYVIHHDASFARLTGEGRAAEELTMDEISALRVKDLFHADGPAQPVATLAQFLQAAKGKIGLYIELKGATADRKMVDDVAAMVRAQGMEKQVVLLSLNYDLIAYSKAHHPDMLTGYLYFFALGEVSHLAADLFIMEEGEATLEKVDAIHEAGKKAVVWTVNTEASMKRFVSSRVDGIITDDVAGLLEAIRERDSRSELQIMLDELLDGVLTLS